MAQFSCRNALIRSSMPRTPTKRDPVTCNESRCVVQHNVPGTLLVTYGGQRTSGHSRNDRITLTPYTTTSRSSSPPHPCHSAACTPVGSTTATHCLLATFQILYAEVERGPVANNNSDWGANCRARA